jgi:hypothetical protein
MAARTRDDHLILTWVIRRRRLLFRIHRQFAARFSKPTRTPKPLPGSTIGRL